jgi:hypothetical protein
MSVCDFGHGLAVQLGACAQGVIPRRRTSPCWPRPSYRCVFNSFVLVCWCWCGRRLRVSASLCCSETSPGWPRLLYRCVSCVFLHALFFTTLVCGAHVRALSRLNTASPCSMSQLCQPACWRPAGLCRSCGGCDQLICSYSLSYTHARTLNSMPTCVLRRPAGLC